MKKGEINVYDSAREEKRREEKTFPLGFVKK